MQTMAWQLDGDTFVLVHGNEEPSDSEWDVYVSQLRQRLESAGGFKALVVTTGGGPNMTQRKRLNDMIQGRSTPTAVVTTSAIGRAVVTLLRLRNPDIRAFEPERLDEAMGHLKFAADEKERMRRIVNDLRQQVGLPNLS